MSYKFNEIFEYLHRVYKDPTEYANQPISEDIKSDIKLRFPDASDNQIEEEWTLFTNDMKRD